MASKDIAPQSLEILLTLVRWGAPYKRLYNFATLPSLLGSVFWLLDFLIQRLQSLKFDYEDLSSTYMYWEQS